MLLLLLPMLLLLPLLLLPMQQLLLLLRPLPLMPLLLLLLHPSNSVARKKTDLRVGFFVYPLVFNLLCVHRTKSSHGLTGLQRSICHLNPAETFFLASNHYFSLSSR
jgi:hypothetical protein